MKIYCPFCGHGVKTERGLRQHIDAKPVCRAKKLSKAGLFDVSKPCLKPPPVASIPKRILEESDSPNHFDLSGIVDLQCLPKAKRPRRFLDHEGHENGGTGKTYETNGSKILRSFNEKQLLCMLEHYLSSEVFGDEGEETSSESNEQELQALEESSSEGELEIVGGPDEDDTSQNSEGDDEVSVPPSPAPDVAAPPVMHVPDYNNDLRININPNTEMLAKFRQYCDERRRLMSTFSIYEKRNIKLLGVLKGTRASLKTYDKILEWHHREKGDISEREGLEHVDNVDKYISRRQMLKILRQRYFLTDKQARTETIRLPNSKATVTMVFHNAWDCIESLLTDPRVKDDDYNFHGNNPLAAPPPITNDSTISELHTAMAYKKAYEKYIKYPGKQVLLPIVMYIDGAVTGQFSDLPVTALKIALGIHTRKHRDKEMAWRTLGYVAQVLTPSSRGKNLLKESGHMEAQNLYLERGEGEDDTTKDVCKAQDFHTMLECLLSSFVEFQNNGFIWDLRYRGKTFRGIEFVPFVIFVKCDTDEADLLCGSFKSRTSNVAQLCRYCTCPTMESDCVYSAYPQKTVPMIHELVEARDFDGLR